MERRDFLKMLLASPLSGSAGGLKSDTLSDSEIDVVWQQLETNPVTFEVSDDGTLSAACMQAPESRGQWIGLTISDRPRAGEILELSEQYWMAKLQLAEAYLEARGDDGDPALVKDKVLRDWLHESDENVHTAGNKLRQWLADDDLDEEDYAEAESQGTTPQGAALLFWRDGKLDRRKFGVVIIDGQCPGNDYYAAHLRIPTDEANASAQAQGLPIRFIVRVCPSYTD